MSKRTDLVYPIYLDVPMMISFLAALEDGVAYGADVTTKSERRTGATGDVQAEARLLPAISSLLNFDLRGRLAGQKETADSEQITVVRRHTEASLFIRLRAEMRRRELIIFLDEDLSRWSQLKRSDLVEVSGQLARNPVSEVLAAFERFLPFTDVETYKQKGAPGSRKGKKQIQQTEWSQGVEIMKVIKEDIEKSPVRDVILKVPNSDLRFVIGLSSEFADDETIEKLLGGEFTVLGKVTKKLEEGESVSLLRRSALGYLAQETIDTTLEEIAGSSEINITLAKPTVDYPAVQVIPLAIFV